MEDSKILQYKGFIYKHAIMIYTIVTAMYFFTCIFLLKKTTTNFEYLSIVAGTIIVYFIKNKNDNSDSFILASLFAIIVFGIKDALDSLSFAYNRLTNIGFLTSRFFTNLGAFLSSAMSVIIIILIVLYIYNYITVGQGIKKNKLRRNSIILVISVVIMIVINFFNNSYAWDLALENITYIFLLVFPLWLLGKASLKKGLIK